MDEEKKASCTNCGQKLTVTDPTRPRGIKIPLLLQCSHTVCEKCLMASLRDKGSITCKKCNHESKVDFPISPWFKWEETLYEIFPLNLYLLGEITIQQRRMADEKNPRYGTHPLPQKEKPSRVIPAGFPLNERAHSVSKNKVPRMKFYVCVECEKKADLMCKNCNDFYCNGCFLKCHQFKSQRKHEKVPIESLGTDKQTETEEKLAPDDPGGTCSKHVGQKLDFFCKDCDMYCCSYCVAVCEPEHSDHTVRPVSEIGKEVTHNLLIAREEGIAQMNVLMNEISSLKEDTKHDDAKEVVTTIVNHFAALHGRLQNLETKLMKVIQSFTAEMAKNTEATQAKLQEHIDDLRFLLEEADRSLKTNATAGMAQILKQLQSLKEQPYIIERSKADSSMRFSAQETVVYDLDNHFTLDVPTPRSYSFKKNDTPLLAAEDMEKIAANSAEWLKEKMSAIVTPLSNNSRSASYASLDGQLPQKSGHSNPSRPASCASIGTVDNVKPRPSSQMPIVRGCIAPNSSEHVKVSHIRTLSSFFVLRLTDEKFLNDLTVRIQRHMGKNKHHPTEITQNSLYLVVYGQDKQWYRGRVTEVKGNTVEVFYIDYGNSERVPKAKLRSMPIEFTNIPSLAIHCSIANVYPRGAIWDPEAIKWFASVVDGATLLCRVFAVGNDVCHVDLGEIPGDDFNIPMSVSDALLFLEWGQIADSSPLTYFNDKGSAVKPQPESYGKNTRIAVGETIKVMVSHIDTPSHFYVQQMTETVNYIYSISKDLNDTYFQPPSLSYPLINRAIYSPTIGMPCAVQFTSDKQWYRAQVTGLPGNKTVEVQYVDYGNKEVVPYTSLRRVSKRVQRIPALAILCELSDVVPVDREWSTAAAEFLREKTNSSLCSVMVNAKVEEKHAVTLYENRNEKDVNLNGLLVKEGYAVCTGPGSKGVEFVKPSDVLSEEAKKMMKRNQKKLKDQKRKRDFIPDLSTDELLEQATPQQPEVHQDPYKLEVKLIKAQDPSSIYVAVKYHLPHIENMFDEMRTVYAGSVTEKVDWKPGMNCAYKKTSDPTWYRGVVMDILKPDYALVALNDTVEVVEANFSELRTLEARFENLPNPIKCRIAGIIPTGGTAKWSKAACEFVESFVKTHTKSTFISKKGEIEDMLLPADVYICESYTAGPLEPTVEKWYTLSEKLIEAGLAMPIRGDHKQEPSIMSDVVQELEANYKVSDKDSRGLFANVAPSTSDNLPSESEANLDTHSSVTLDDSSGDDEDLTTYVRQGMKCDEETLTLKYLPPLLTVMDSFTATPSYVDDKGFIYIHDFIRLPLLEDLQASLQKTFQKSYTRPEDLYWHPGQLCIAQYHLDEQWYRAQFLKYADDEKALVMFVDYGNVETCDVAMQLRKCAFRVDVPIMATKCYLYNVVPVGEKWCTEALDCLHKMLVAKSCKVTCRSTPEMGKPLLVSILTNEGLDPSFILIQENYAKLKKMAMPVGGKSEGLPLVTEDTLETSRKVLCALAGHTEDQLLQPLPSNSSPKKPGPIDDITDEQINEIKEPLFNDIKEKFSPSKEIDKILETLNQQYQASCTNVNSDDGSTIESESEVKDKHDNKDNGSDLEEPCKLNGIEDNDEGCKLLEWYDIVAQDEKKEALHMKAESPLPGCSSSYGFSTDKEDTTGLSGYCYEDPPEESELQVTVLGVESSQRVLIYCHRSKDIEDERDLKFTKLMKVLKEEAPQQPQLFNPVQGMICVACCAADNIWYRAKVMAVDFVEETMVVQYVDYANYELLSFDRIVAMKPEWTTLPVQVLPCTLWHIVRPDHATELEVKTNLEGALLNRRVLAVIKEREPVLTASLYNVQRTELAYETLLETQLLLLLD